MNKIFNGSGFTKKYHPLYSLSFAFQMMRCFVDVERMVNAEKPFGFIY